MKTTDHHEYELRHYGSNEFERIRFSDKESRPVSPFLERPGTTIEEVLSAVIDRVVYEKQFAALEHLRIGFDIIKGCRPEMAHPNTNPPLVTVANMEGRDVGE